MCYEIATTLILHSSSVFNISLVSGDSSGDDSDLINYCAQFVAFEHHMLSACGGLSCVSVRGKRSRLQCFG